MRFQWLEQPRARHRRRAPFKSGYQSTLKLLERELDAIHARNVVLAAGFPTSQIRNDGYPYASARPQHVAVALHFDIKGQQACFPCDTFDRYEDNLRAIALSLEALRKVDRYGVTRNQEQYTGWLRLEAAADPAEVLRTWSGAASTAEVRAADKNGLASIYRAAARRAHPDAGGSQDDFIAVTQAYTTLQKQRGFTQ